MVLHTVWETLCREFRNQLKDRHSNLDLRVLIRNRKQMVAEQFGTYNDRREIAIPNNELVEIFKRNLHPDYILFKGPHQSNRFTSSFTTHPSTIPVEMGALLLIW
ncbi:hypothetical protein GQX74_011377 [Glossina fuscipes]|nr:hypothetical protein GQX74_011377 [Glossina fuscipes]